MSQYMKVPRGESPEEGVVVCRGREYNLWRWKEEFATEYEVLTTTEALIEGMKMRPGTLPPGDVARVRQEVMRDYGVDIRDVEIQAAGDTVSLEEFMRDYTRNDPEGWIYRAEPFDISLWE